MDTTTSRSSEHTTFLCDILATAVEGGINYWASIDFRDDLDPAAPERLGEPTEVRIIDREDQTMFTVDHDAVDTGLQLACTAMSEGVIRDYPEFRLACDTHGEEGDFDATTADLAIQYAIFGTVLYG